ncbi:hypothetical protein LOTGIDRAFT_154889 [Lottia gigantea]|uniref:J domain-containing protein n=1 Tax=Lottia gigantea TaxID=225164 RepID=V4B954_LOTGI|nr:hypothetical protein LOTGIDRAFT_154889 [Lottia gigantea]ESO85394.1 hypothetical protein LOTGIDRAFT_154889 [Lottia gigantea]
MSIAEWYKTATSGLAKYQQEEITKEEVKYQEERKVIMTKIKDQINELETKFKTSGKLQFLEFVYKNYPPKNKKHKLAEIPYIPELQQIKKFYQKVVVHYHPDKVDIKKHGMEWKVLSEEIVKILTRQYEHYKGF